MQFLRGFCCKSEELACEHVVIVKELAFKGLLVRSVPSTKESRDELCFLLQINPIFTSSLQLKPYKIIKITTKIVEVLLLREQNGKQRSPSAVNLFSSQPIKSYAFCFPTVLTKSKQKISNKKIKKKGENKEAGDFLSSEKLWKP